MLHNKRTYMRYLCVLILLLIAIPIRAQVGLEPYQWELVRGAVIYRGTVKTSSAGPYQFSTPHHKVLLPIRSKGMVIEARDGDGHIIKRMKVDKPVILVLNNDGSADDGIYDDADLDAEPDVEVDDKRFFDDFVPIKYTTYNRRSSDKRLTTSLGFGNENLKVSGGISSFGSNATIGGTRLTLEWHRVRKNKRIFGALIGGEAHVHNATVNETDETTSQTTQSEYHFFRGRMNVMGLYHFDSYLPSTHQIGLGLGLGSTRLPMMSITDDSTGQSKPKVQTAYGPKTGIIYRFLFTTSHEFGIQVSYLAMGLGEIKKTSSLDFTGHYAYFIDENKGLFIAYTNLQESAKSDLTCPSVTLCKETARTTARSSSLNLGLAIAF